MIVLLCALLSGGMFYLSQGLDDVWPLAWIAPVPLLWLAYRVVPRWQVALASLAAFGCGQIYVAQCYGNALPAWMIVPLETAMCALFTAAVLLGGAARLKLGAVAALGAFAVAWTASEYIIERFSIHGSFGSLAYAEVPFPPCLQIASLFGLHAVTLVLCLFANALALLLHRHWRAGGAGLAACLLALAFGYVRLAQPEGPVIQVAALADADSWQAENRDRTLMSRVAASIVYANSIRARSGLQVVVIPEGALQMTQAAHAPVLAPLAAAARASGALVVAGTYVLDPGQNRAFAAWPNGTTVFYAKRHPLAPLEPEPPGHSLGLLSQSYGTQICKDMDFPQSVRQTAQHGTRLMIVPANDFATDGWIHARMAIMDGVENGFAVLRSALNGVETISDAQGRILAQASTLQPGMIASFASVPLGPGPTLYTRIGDILGAACAVLSLAILALLVAHTVTYRASAPRGDADQRAFGQRQG